MGISVNTYAFVKPGPVMTASTDEKLNFNCSSTASIDLKDYPEGHEMLGADIFINQRLYGGHKVKAAIEFYEDSTGQLLWKGDYTVPDPCSEGWSWWESGFQVKFWIGHVQWEIYRAMTVRMEVHVYGDPIPTTNYTIRMGVKDSAYVPPAPVDPVTPVEKGKYVEVYFKDVSKYGVFFSPIPGFIGGGVSALIAYKGDLIWKVQQALPLGYSILEVDIDPEKVTLKFKETGSVWAIIGIVAAVVAVLLLFGLIWVKVKEYDWKKEQAKAEQTSNETEQIPVRADCVAKLMGLGMSEEGAVKVCGEADKTDDTDWFSKIENLMIMAIGAVIIIMLIQQVGHQASGA